MWEVGDGHSEWKAQVHKPTRLDMFRIQNFPDIGKVMWYVHHTLSNISRWGLGQNPILKYMHTCIQIFTCC